jgi:hypothetical protein
MASRSIGKAWQRGNGKSLETRCVEGLLVSLCAMCVLAIFDGCQKTVLVSVRAYTKLSTFSAPITMALTKKRKATALEEDATLVKSGYSEQALIAALMWPFRAKTRMMDSSVLASAHGRSLLRREASFITQKSRGSVINTSTSQTRYVHMGPHTTLHLRSECKPSCCL